MIFAAITERLIENASLDHAIKIGFTSNKERAGKSFFAESILSKIFGKDSYNKYMAGNVWNNGSGKSVLHFDNKRIEQANFIYTAPNIINLVGTEPSDANMLGIMPIKNELAKLQQQSAAHFIEWPNGRSSGVNALWHLSEDSDGALNLEFYCTDEIASMPETKELLENAAQFDIA